MHQAYGCVLIERALKVHVVSLCPSSISGSIRTLWYPDIALSAVGGIHGAAAAAVAVAVCSLEKHARMHTISTSLLFIDTPSML